MQLTYRGETHSHFGFTLIEMVVTVSIVAILATIAAPNFRTFVLNNRLTSTSQELLRTLQSARSEATKRQKNIVICLAASLDTSPSCVTNNTKPTGWILFEDGNTNWTYDDGTSSLLQKHYLSSTKISLLADGSKKVSYAPTGFATVGSGTDQQKSNGIIVCDSRGNATSSGDLSVARGLIINGTGRASVTKYKTSITDMITASGSSCS
jgi:type IV fimbrial biogenesis protein FimT